MNGILTCAKYAFAPNFYQYCGPDENQELKAYLNAQQNDKNLDRMLKQFSTLISYLKSIAHANKIADPFDPRVVEAYWIGNDLLENVPAQSVYLGLTDNLQIQKKIPQKYLKYIFPKIDQGARFHHSFHVFNVFVRTGHHTITHTVDTMDQCRIAWGKIKKINQQSLLLDSQQLVYLDGKLLFKNKVERTIQFFTKEKFKVGDYVTFHWGFLCDKVSKEQADNLKKYTQFHLDLANQTL